MQRGLKFVDSQLNHNTYTNIIERKLKRALTLPRYPVILSYVEG